MFPRMLHKLKSVEFTKAPGAILAASFQPLSARAADENAPICTMDAPPAVGLGAAGAETAGFRAGAGLVTGGVTLGWTGGVITVTGSGLAVAGGGVTTTGAGIALIVVRG